MTEEKQEVTINIPDITTLTIKDGDVLLVQVPNLPTHIFQMVKKQLQDDLERCGIDAHVILLDNKIKLTVVSKEDNKK
jgi:hypothetical protein